MLAAALSIDNVIVGFALGTNHTNLMLAVILVALFSVGLSLIGFELGHRLGTRVEDDSEKLSAIVPIAVGILLLTNIL